MADNNRDVQIVRIVPKTNSEEDIRKVKIGLEKAEIKYRRKNFTEIIPYAKGTKFLRNKETKEIYSSNCEALKLEKEIVRYNVRTVAPIGLFLAS